ncbi:MAG: ribose-phosphate pyrophosphokinase [Rickettsiaceae bacterium]|nr:ribose-phosphate pyrophosphokinase [Rickettsiaceae bacterium]
MQILAGSNSINLAKLIAQKKQITLLDYQVKKYPDSEFQITIKDNIANQVAIIQSVTRPVNDSLIELLFLADICKKAGAKEIIAIIPYLAYSRQGRPNKYNNAAPMNLVAQMLKLSGITRLITLDLHNKHLESIFDLPIINISFNEIFKISEQDNIVLISPDIGGIERVRSVADNNYPIAIINKHRLNSGECIIEGIIGDIKGKNCIIIDDIVDSATTLCQAADLLKKLGAHNIEAYVTHGILSDNAVEKINNSDLDKITLSNSIDNNETLLLENQKFNIYSVADIITRYF